MTTVRCLSNKELLLLLHSLKGHPKMFGNATIISGLTYPLICWEKLFDPPNRSLDEDVEKKRWDKDFEIYIRTQSKGYPGGLTPEAQQRIHDSFWKKSLLDDKPPSLIQALKRIAGLFVYRRGPEVFFLSAKVQQRRYQPDPGFDLLEEPEKHWFRLTRHLPATLVLASSWLDEGKTLESLPRNKLYVHFPQLDEVVDETGKVVGDYHMHIGLSAAFDAFCWWRQEPEESLDALSKDKVDKYWEPIGYRGRQANVVWVRWLSETLTWLCYGLFLASKQDKDFENHVVVAQASKFWQSWYPAIFPRTAPEQGSDELFAKIQEIKAHLQECNDLFNCFSKDDLPDRMGDDQLFLLLNFADGLEAQENPSIVECAFLFWFDKLIRIRLLLYALVVQQPGIWGLSGFMEWVDRYDIAEKERVSIGERLKAVAFPDWMRYVEFRVPFPKYGKSSSLDSFTPLADNISIIGSRKETKKKIYKHLISFGDYCGWGKKKKCVLEKGRYVWKKEHAKEDKKRRKINLAFSMALVKEELKSKKLEQGVVHYAKLINRYRAQVSGFLQLLNKESDLLYLVRGLDCFAKEKVNPNWLAALVYQQMNQQIDQSSANKIYAFADEKRPPMRHTFHAGEDFDWIMQGLRVIYEAVNQSHGFLQKGERIGHGVALGLDPIRWCQESPVVPLRLGDALDDLVWAWGVLQKKSAPHAFNYLEQNDASFQKQLPKQDSRPATIIRQLERLIYHLLRILNYNAKGREFKHYTHGILSIRPLWQAYKNRYDFKRLTDGCNQKGLIGDLQSDNWFSRERVQAFFKEKAVQPEWAIYQEYLTDKDFYEACQEPFNINFSALPFDGAIVTAWLQRIVREEIIQAGIAVECCPTSNLSITPVGDDYDNHPIFRLVPLDSNQDEEVPAFVNSDDPIIFASDVIGEYRMLYHAARRKGYTRVQVKRWLAKIIRYGYSYRFHPSKEERARKKIRKLYHRWKEH
ncbi:hypothetical protein ACQZV8_08905 [Magnetococcales bacterium HHB-1]